MSSNKTTTHGRHSQALCLAPGLFRTTKRGTKREKFEMSYRTDSCVTDIGGPEHLEADDLKVLQGLVSLASTYRIYIDTDDVKSEEGLEYARLIKGVKGPDGKGNIYCGLTTTLYRLAAEIGYKGDSPKVREAILASLRRMRRIWIDQYQREDRTDPTPFDFLGFSAEENGQQKNKQTLYRIALNPLIAMAALKDYRFVHIDMNEVRSLSSAPSRLLHQRLSALVGIGSSRRLSMSSLMGYVWEAEASRSAIRSRRSAIREALSQISATGGWSIERAVDNRKDERYDIRRLKSRTCK